MLPASVLQTIQSDMMNFRGTGISILEIGHRTPAFGAMLDELTMRVRSLLSVPDTHEILFCTGGGRTQFSMVPMNLLGADTTASYLVTGMWSALAQKEAEKYAHSQIVFDHYGVSVPQEPIELGQTAYCYTCDNETVDGVEFAEPPILSNPRIPLVSDMTSNIMSRPIDFSRYGLIWAAVQKNFGTSGLTLVIVRRDLLGLTLANAPTMLNYSTYVEQHNLPNTPPLFQMYVSNCMAQWIEKQGGVTQLDLLAKERSRVVYEVMDRYPEFYQSRVHRASRSRMNVVFQLAEPQLTDTFVQEAAAQGLRHLAGHPKVGGLRASLYNAMPLSGAEALADFMKHFAEKHAKVVPMPTTTSSGKAGHDEVPVIAIDGPAASGKGTIAEIVAQRLGFHYLDSGALYRLATVWAMMQKVDWQDTAGLIQAAQTMKPVFKNGRIYLEDQDVTERIRDEDVSHYTSQVAVIAQVREAILALEKSAALAPGLVADGRDMGTVVFPQAHLKVFMTASAQVRAQRRFNQLRARGIEADLQELTHELEMRDKRDQERETAPLKPAVDAVVIDTSEMNIDEVVEKVLSLWRDR